MRSPTVLLSLFLIVSCVRSPPERPPPGLLLQVDTGAPADRMPRLPTVTLQFDHPLAPPHADAIWVLSGRVSDSILSDARRGGLSSSNHPRRLGAALLVHSDDPSRISVTLDRPLAPDATFAVVTTLRLTTDLRAAVGLPDMVPGPMSFPFTVAPAAECPPLARLAFPSHDAVPRESSHFVIAFDRPVRQWRDDSPAIVRDAQASEIPSTSSLACGTNRTGFRCVHITPAATLEPESDYTIALGSLRDDGGLSPQEVELRFRTSTEMHAPATLASAPLVCSAGEITRPPFCVKITAAGIELRGTTRSDGALRVSAAGVTAESAAATEHRVRLDPLPADRPTLIHVSTIGMDGSIGETFALEAVQTSPATPPVRIVEVLARPHSSSAQEFVEVLNEGSQPCQLEGLVIATASGSSELPAAEIAPGARAVIVGASFDPAGVPREGDPPVAPGALVVRLANAIASRGLADRGVDVWLADASGHAITRCPLGSGAPLPLEGVSLVRADPRMGEDDPAAWTYDAAGGSTPGDPDRLR